MTCGCWRFSKITNTTWSGRGTPAAGPVEVGAHDVTATDNVTVMIPAKLRTRISIPDSGRTRHAPWAANDS
jgi:hypothetical protein